MTGIQQEKTERTETGGPPLSLLPPVKSESGSSASLVPRGTVAEALRLMLAALQAAQPADCLQQLQVFSNGRALAIYAGGSIRFDDLNNLDEWVGYVNANTPSRQAATQETKP